MSKYQALLKQFKKALKRLKDALDQEPNEFIRDSAIQRFEFTFDLSWKLIKTYLEEEKGLLCRSPKACFREAYKQELLEHDEFWLEMTDIRNQTAHTYNEKLAKEIFDKLPEIVGYFDKLSASIK